MARRSGQIIARGDRKWLARWFLGTDERGKKRYASKTVHGTKRDAQRLLNEVLRSRDLGTHVEPTKLTLNAYLDRWLESAHRRLAARTHDDYTQLLIRYVRPTLGPRRLDSIRPLDVQAIYNAMQERGIGPRTVRMAHAVLGSTLKQAVRWGLLAQNPAALADLPRQRRSEKRALSTDEVTALRKAAVGTRYALLWEFMLSTGCRPGEALALSWPDFDPQAGTITIRHALSRVSGGRYEIKEPKTARSRRTIPLPARIVTALADHRRQQAKIALRVGPAYRRDLALIFATELGTPQDPVNLNRRYLKPLARAAGVSNPETVSPYTLRHTCATLLGVQANINPRVVADRLGHTSTTLVLDVYGHVLEGMQAEATKRLEEVLTL